MSYVYYDDQAQHASTLDASRRLTFSGPIISGLLIILDALLISVSGLGLYYLLVHPDGAIRFYLVIVAFYAVLMCCFLSANELYSPIEISRRPFQLRRLIKLILISFFILLGVLFGLKVSLAYSRVWAFSWLAFLVVAMPVARLLCGALILKLAREGFIARNVAIIANTNQAAKLLERIENSEEVWLRVIDVFDARGAQRSNMPLNAGNKAPLDHLMDSVESGKVDDIVIALPWSAVDRITMLLDKFERAPVRVSICPNLIGFKYRLKSPTHMAGVPLWGVYEKPIGGWLRLLKIAMDYLIGGSVLLLAAPLLGLIALCIKLDSEGPVFFVQNRVGFNGKLFKLYKFRTMRVEETDHNADKITTRNDARVTRVGRILRRYSLDELPQLLNVMDGSMSLVGPRPHAINAKAAGKRYEEQVERYLVRHKVKPGITGWAQVNGWRGNTDTVESIEKRTECDLYYIYNWSPFFDLEILVRTFGAVISTENAY